MRQTKGFLIFLIFLFAAGKSFSQDRNLLDTLPVTKEEFVKSEPAVINTIEWLENTPLNQEPEKRKQIYNLFLAWLTNSPTVSVNIDARIATFTKKNADLLFIFMGGWTKYALQNAYSNDPVKCNLAGIKSAIKVYQMGNGLKKDKEMDKLIALDSKNELELWIASQLGKK